MNEETIRHCRWGKTLGCIASSITVNLPEPGHIHRARQGGRRTRCFAPAKCTAASRRGRKKSVGWSATPQRQGDGESLASAVELVANVMGNGSPPAPPAGAEILQSEPLRRFSTRLGSEAIRVGQAQGYQLEEILHLPPDTIARAARRRARCAPATNSVQGRQAYFKPAAPSMGQDMQKAGARRLNPQRSVVREARRSAFPAANAALTDISHAWSARAEPDPRHITELRMN